MYVCSCIDLLSFFIRGGDFMTFEITSELIKPIETAISSGLTTLVPIGIGIMAAFIGISLIPRIIYRFL